MNIRPINKNVAVKFIEKDTEKETESGIVLPDTAQKEKEPQQGKVIAISNECETILSINDTVVFDKYASSSINVDGDEFLILDIEDVLAVIN